MEKSLVADCATEKRDADASINDLALSKFSLIGRQQAVWAALGATEDRPLDEGSKWKLLGLLASLSSQSPRHA